MVLTPGEQQVIREHVQMMQRAGIGILVYSWWGRAAHSPGDANGRPTDDRVVSLVLDACQAAGLRVAFHLEPYEGRNEQSVRSDLDHLAEAYGGHPALLRHRERGNRPIVFMYDSYQTPPEAWHRVLGAGGDLSVRGGLADFLVLGLWVERSHGEMLVRGGFDGFYTYFATEGMTWGSTHANWQFMADFAHKHTLLFVPSVGPGYVDTAVRPWNSRNRRERRDGEYFSQSLDAAARVMPSLLSLTSFNEWHEGTQIEPAVPRDGYLDYGTQAPTPPPATRSAECTCRLCQGDGLCVQWGVYVAPCI